MDDSTAFWLAFGLLGIICAMAGYIISWGLRPENKAFILRKLTGKNYVLIKVLRRGGQLQTFCKKYDEPSIEAKKKRFLPKGHKPSCYIGSIPCWIFNEDDAFPLGLQPLSENEKGEMAKLRDPEHLNDFLMLMKAFFETLAQKSIQTLIYVVIAVALLQIINLYMGWLNLQSSNVCPEALAAVKNLTMNSTQLVNKL